MNFDWEKAMGKEWYEETSRRADELFGPMSDFTLGFTPDAYYTDEDFTFMTRLIWPYRDTWRKEQMIAR